MLSAEGLRWLTLWNQLWWMVIWEVTLSVQPGDWIVRYLGSLMLQCLFFYFFGFTYQFRKPCCGHGGWCMRQWGKWCRFCCQSNRHLPSPKDSDQSRCCCRCPSGYHPNPESFPLGRPQHMYYLYIDQIISVNCLQIPNSSKNRYGTYQSSSFW